MGIIFGSPSESQEDPFPGRTSKRMRKALLVGLGVLFVLASVAYTKEETLSRESVLLWAAGKNLLAQAEKALALGSSPEERDFLGNTPLHAAVRYPEMIAFLLRNGGDPGARNALGETPLHLAVPYRESVERLLAAGADPWAADAFGRTPVDLCMDRGSGSYNLSILDLLLSK